jgi:hypothetical protein
MSGLAVLSTGQKVPGKIKGDHVRAHPQETAPITNLQADAMRRLMI